MSCQVYISTPSPPVAIRSTPTNPLFDQVSAQGSGPEVDIYVPSEISLPPLLIMYFVFFSVLSILLLPLFYDKISSLLPTTGGIFYVHSILLGIEYLEIGAWLYCQDFVGISHLQYNSFRYGFLRLSSQTFYEYDN